MKYIKPNLNREWMEAIRYPEFKKMGKDGWFDVASKKYSVVSYDTIKDVLGNVNLDYDSLEDEKKKRFEETFKKGRVEIPIAVKFSDDDYDLLGGNTRLAGLLMKGENPKIYVIDMSKNKVKKIEPQETDASSAGGFEGPAFSIITKKKLQEEVLGTGEYDVPFLGKSPKGRKNPLKIGGTDTIYKNRAVKDKNGLDLGGPDAVYVKIKEKCKKFPYCNQGINALEFIHENQEIIEAIEETSKKYGIPYNEVEKVVINEINKIFI